MTPASTMSHRRHRGAANWMVPVRDAPVCRRAAAPVCVCRAFLRRGAQDGTVILPAPALAEIEVHCPYLARRSPIAHVERPAEEEEAQEGSGFPTAAAAAAAAGVEGHPRPRPPSPPPPGILLPVLRLKQEAPVALEHEENFPRHLLYKINADVERLGLFSETGIAGLYATLQRSGGRSSAGHERGARGGGGGLGTTATRSVPGARPRLGATGPARRQLQPASPPLAATAAAAVPVRAQAQLGSAATDAPHLRRAQTQRLQKPRHEPRRRVVAAWASGGGGSTPTALSEHAADAGAAVCNAAGIATTAATTDAPGLQPPLPARPDARECGLQLLGRARSRHAAAHACVRVAFTVRCRCCSRNCRCGSRAVFRP